LAAQRSIAVARGAVIERTRGGHADLELILDKESVILPAISAAPA